jgi:tetratricopeptide (TPR) repeat protein
MAKGRTKTKKAAVSIPGGAIFDPRVLQSILAGMDLLQEDDPDDFAAAQEIIWDAWDAPNSRQRVALAEKALKLSPLCADAYVVLAQETAKSEDDALRLYRQGVDAGEKALGKTAFRDDVGHFWGILETRPYMRARQGVAQCLWRTGAREEAVTHYRDMLRLNPNDNQGIRYMLLDCLLTLGRDAEAGKLLRRYRGDDSAAWSWSGALATFRREGDTAASAKALAKAIRSNIHVPAYLLGRKKLPRNLPAFYSLGGKDEAIAYAHDSAEAWAAAAGALKWIEDTVDGFSSSGA